MHTISPNTPKFKLVEREVLGWIRSGRYRPGDKLPAELAMATELGMNHLTVRRGLEDLAQAGVIEKVPRVGNFVKATRARELSVSVALLCPRFLFGPNGQHPMVGALVSGVCGELDHRDYTFSMLAYTPGRLWDEVGPTLIERGVRGVLLDPARFVPLDDIRHFEKEGIRVVIVGFARDIAFEGVVSGSVTMASQSVLEQAMPRLLELGHRRITCVCYTESAFRRPYEAIMQRYCTQYPELGTLDNTMYYISDRGGPADYSSLERLFDREPRPTAFITGDEFMAAELFRIAYRRHLRVPQDFSIISLHNSTPQAFPVALASPDTLQYVLKIGEQAAKRLAELLDGKTLDQPFLRIEKQLQWGESIAPPKL